MRLEISDWNMIPYAGAWSRQTEWFDALVHAKQTESAMSIILCSASIPMSIHWGVAEKKGICCWEKNNCAG